MKPNFQPTFAFVLTIAAFAIFSLPGSATTLTFPAATITTSLNQCESQDCGPDAPLASYNGALSGYSTQTVGEGANVSASGFSFPTLNSQVPLAGANAAINGELIYDIAVVPIGGGSTVTNVQLGASGTGSISVTTVSNTAGSNDATDFTNVQLELLSTSSGTAVFNDVVNLVYSASPVNGGGCTTSNTSNASSTTPGEATVSTPGVNGASVSCGPSNMFGGFTEAGSYTVSSNTLYEVVMEANLTIGTSNDGLAQGSGSVQGSATVDPIFTAPSGYMIEVSPGVGNTLPSSAPEPATWIIFVTGIGLLGVGARQRRNRSIE